MAGGPIFPYSSVPDTSGGVFPNIHVANVRYEEGLGLEASIAADRIWHLRFQMPPTLPTGTGKLLFTSMAAAVTGTVIVDPQWVSVAAAEDGFTATLFAEGNTTITWASGDTDKYLVNKVTLNADTLVAGEIVVMNLVFKSTGSLAVISTHQAAVIWE